MEKWKLLLLLLPVWFFSSCGDNENEQNLTDDPSEGLTKIVSFSDDNYLITLYNKNGVLKSGYNDLYFTVADLHARTISGKDTLESWVSNAKIKIIPEMDMGTMKHGCPYSEILKSDSVALYHGYILFPMSGDWNLQVNYSVGNATGSITQLVTVNQSDKQRISSFTGNDSNKYVIALVEPQEPVVGTNDITALLYHRIDGYTYDLVTDYKIKLDPRMPSMGNHTSPNNVDLTWNKDIYKGTVNFSMTGDWTLNLILEDSEGNILKGEEISDSAKASSLYFEVEF